MTTKTTRPEVGQTLYVATPVGRRHEMKPLLVTRVGHKWFYAAPEGASSRAERQFDLELWAENTHLGLGPYALTVDEYAERQARAAAVERLKATGYRIEGVSYDRSRCDLTPAQLHAIAEIIEKEPPMTDQTAPAVTDDDRRLARKWAKSIESRTETWTACTRAAVRVILDAVPTPAPPTLADMTKEERDGCRWMQCDVKGDDRRVVILVPDASVGRALLLDQEPNLRYAARDEVTPRPDLPRMEWPAGQDAEEAAPVKVGDVIESADDPRLDALPVGTILRDCDGEEVAKRGGDWAGIGYIPRESEGTEFGPWTVRRIGWEADQ